MGRGVWQRRVLHSDCAALAQPLPGYQQISCRHNLQAQQCSDLRDVRAAQFPSHCRRNEGEKALDNQFDAHRCGRRCRTQRRHVLAVVPRHAARLHMVAIATLMLVSFRA